MLDSVLRLILIPPLLIGVTILVIIGLINFDLMVAIAAKLIAGIVVVGSLVLIGRLLFFGR